VPSRSNIKKFTFWSPNRRSAASEITPPESITTREDSGNNHDTPPLRKEECRLARAPSCEASILSVADWRRPSWGYKWLRLLQPVINRKLTT